VEGVCVVKVLVQRCQRVVTMLLLKCCYSVVTVLLQCCYSVVTVLLQYCYSVDETCRIFYNITWKVCVCVCARVFVCACTLVPPQEHARILVLSIFQAISPINRIYSRRSLCH
jgi:hypothetical protein